MTQTPQYPTQHSIDLPLQSTRRQPNQIPNIHYADFSRFQDIDFDINSLSINDIQNNFAINHDLLSQEYNTPYNSRNKIYFEQIHSIKQQQLIRFEYFLTL